MAKEIKVELEDGFETMGDMVTELVLATPRFKHLVEMDKVSGDLEKILVLIAALAQMPKKDVAEMSLADLKKVQEALDPFLGSPTA